MRLSDLKDVEGKRVYVSASKRKSPGEIKISYVDLMTRDFEINDDCVVINLDRALNLLNSSLNS